MNPEACEQKSGDREQWKLYIMYSLALFRVELETARGRLLSVFDVLDETFTARTLSTEIANERESVVGLECIETSLDVRRSTTASISR